MFARDGKILRGKMKPRRKFHFAETDVRSIRERYKLSQEKFAVLLGISTAALRIWKQARRKPVGPAKMLLRVAAKYPEAVLDVADATKVTK